MSVFKSNVYTGILDKNIGDTELLIISGIFCLPIFTRGVPRNLYWRGQKRGRDAEGVEGSEWEGVSPSPAD